MRDAVRGACELLGLDPLHIANEGQFLAVVAPESADAALAAIRADARRQKKRVSSAKCSEQPPAPCSSPRGTAARASSTCWSAIHCRASARTPKIGNSVAFGDQVAQRLLGAQSALRELLRPRSRAPRRSLPRNVRAFLARRPSAGLRPRALRHRRAARLGRIRASRSSSASAPCPRSISPCSFRRGCETIVAPEDIVMGFGPPEGDPEVWAALASARARGAMTFALPGRRRHLMRLARHLTIPSCIRNSSKSSITRFGRPCTSSSSIANSVTTSAQPAFSIPSSDRRNRKPPTSLVEGREHPFRMKVADDAKLREHVAQQAVRADRECRAGDSRTRAQRRQTHSCSATAARPPTPTTGRSIACCRRRLPRRFPAISLSLEPANITAIANDVGTELIFLRQLIAQARPEDVAIGISTSGGSRNIVIALEEARKRGLLTVALLGYDGGEILRRGLADFPMVVRSRLHPAHSGSAGLRLPRDPRKRWRFSAVAKLNSSAPAPASKPRKCASGSNGGRWRCRTVRT